MSVEQCYAAVFPAPGGAPEVRAYPIPAVQPGAVLVKTLASEVCGTDVHLWHGRLAGVPYPLIPGHVSIGTIAVTGGKVLTADEHELQPGDVVTFLDVHGTCGVCIPCAVWKASTRCPHRRVYGITFGADEPPGLSGGWSEYIYLRPGTKILKVASNVSPDAWIGAGCGLPTAVHAIELARIHLGDRVLIQGSGPVGLSACALALLSGAGWVGVIGSPSTRLAAASAIGADLTIDITCTTQQDRLRMVRAATGGYGADIVLEASGSPDAIPEGCNLVRDAGRYIVVGQYTDNGDVAINPHLHINKKHIELLGCWGSDYSHVYRAMQVLSRFESRIHWSALISRRYSLHQVAEALTDVEAHRVVKAVIVPS